MKDKVYPTTIYFGKRRSQSGHQPVYKRIMPDGDVTELSPEHSQKLRLHSPDGFQWGYGGSGPAQTALALLLDVTTIPDIAEEYYQDFKMDVVSHWGDDWSITSDDIIEWIETRKLEKRAMLSQN